LQKEYVAFLAHIVEKKDEGKKIQDIPIIRDFPEVFPILEFQQPHGPRDTREETMSSSRATRETWNTGSRMRAI
ncbi:MAG: hypothetical protein Q8755_03475, partial [Candidatus Phytoplasma australasiaticum]|nr:hypothetical protein [Candidatus Phytoplasma australasiaticum]